jgi:hypothetical protein
LPSDVRASLRSNNAESKFVFLAFVSTHASLCL